MANLNYNQQNRITKESIFTALMIFMEKKDFKDISITEITKKAGVSRMAFYRNYDTKEDIITSYINEIFKDYTNEVSKREIKNNHENLRLYFFHFRKQSRLINNLISSNLVNMLLDKCIESFYNLSQDAACNKSYPPEKQRYYIGFLVGGLYNVLIDWAKNGMNESDDQMAEIVNDFIYHG